MLAGRLRLQLQHGGSAQNRQGVGQLFDDTAQATADP
jgi:hypothetical protein